MPQKQFLPYVTDPVIDDPYMKRVSVTNAEIGSRPSNMLNDIKNKNAIEHVSNNEIGSTKSSKTLKV